MPTTPEESKKIISISKEYLSQDKLIELFTRLDEEVGKTSFNDSVKQSLAAMRILVDPPFHPSRYLKTALVMVVILHMLLIVGIVVSFIILPFFTPWYIALPLCTFIWFFSTSRIDCKITNLENSIREKLRMKKIGGFLGHYLLRPIKKKYAKK